MKPSMRKKARQYAVQAIYSWQLSKNDVADIELDIISERGSKGLDTEYFRQIFAGVATTTNELDSKVSPFVDRDYSEVDYLEKAILRLGTYELLYRKDVPVKVAINEAIELAKLFAAEDSHKFVNSALDKLAKSL